MRTLFGLVVVLMLVGCGGNGQSADQIAAQEKLSELESAEKLQEAVYREQLVQQMLDTPEKMDRAIAARKQLLKDVADGKITEAERLTKLHELDSRILRDEF